MNQNSKYLRVTIHDNDFRSSLDAICHLLYQIFCFENKFPTEEQLPMLKEYIKHLWYGTHEVSQLMRWGNVDKMDMAYLTPHLELVDFLDIPDWDNAESVYIPMFENAELIMR